MFKPKKEGRLSRRMGRLIVLFAYPGFALFYLSLITLCIGLFYSPALTICSFCLEYTLPLLLITLFLLLFSAVHGVENPRFHHGFSVLPKGSNMTTLLAVFPPNGKHLTAATACGVTASCSMMMWNRTLPISPS